jgi:hypothetical protein
MRRTLSEIWPLEYHVEIIKCVLLSTAIAVAMVQCCFFPRGLAPDKAFLSVVGTTWPAPALSRNSLIRNRSSRRKPLWPFPSRSLTVLIPVATFARPSTSALPVLRAAASVPPVLSPVTPTTNSSSYSQSVISVVTAPPAPSRSRVRFINIQKLQTRRTGMAKTSTGSSVAVDDRTMPSQSGKP